MSAFDNRRERRRRAMQRKFMPTKNAPPKASRAAEVPRISKWTTQIQIHNWEPLDREDCYQRRYATLEICGVPHHLEAVPVEQSDSGEQVGLTPEADDYLGELYQAFGGDGAFHVLNIEGQDYAVFMSPYCQ